MSSASRDPEAADSPRPGPGEPIAPVEITDPRALRALAHPARIAILEHLVLDGPATATECAEVARLSASACSYHLRALAKYGYVEEDKAKAIDGRHRPWRATLVAVSIGGNPELPSATRAAGRLLVESFQSRLDEHRTEYLDREAEYSPQWQRAAGYTQGVVHATAEELIELRERLSALVEEYARLDPANRPPGALRVGTYLEFIPWFDPEASR
ncbi:MAG TPA: winged helix-turn-helix domain-containing protein [Streptosporangiaceae bacterium]|nr:winged helix-turn-helix domain-containing protein [Streptosporangiaceae bacterium]